MTGHPADRLIAWCIDWWCIVAWAAVTAAIGVPLFTSGITHAVSPTVLNVVGAVVLIVPITIAAAWRESGQQQATPGKHRRHLLVVTAASGARVTFRRALVRNAAKIALPWALGHAVVVALTRTSATEAAPGWLWVAVAAAYGLPAVYLASLFFRQGRTPYDWISRTQVVKRFEG